MKRILKVLSLFVLMFVPLTMVKAVSSDYFNDVNGLDDINHSVFIGEDNVKYDHNVNGLAFIFGNNVSVTGTDDYGFVAGNNVNFNGSIKNDLFIAGNNVAILNNDSSIGRDLYAAGNIVTVNENVMGNAFLSGSEVVLKDITINGDVNIAAEKVTILGNVEIGGTFKVNDNAEISNENNLIYGNKETYKTEEHEHAKNIMATLLSGLAMLLILGFVLNLVFPKLYGKVNKNNEIKSSLINMLYGLLMLIVIPIVAIMLFCTIIGVMLGVILLLLYFIGLIIAIIIASMVVGELILTKLFKTSDNAYLSITIGLVLFKLVELVPYIGWLIYFLGFIYGLGKEYVIFKERNE